VEKVTSSRGQALGSQRRIVWHLVQIVVLGCGLGIWLALIFQPPLGLHLLWNVLIPVAPALLVLAPGIWRNVCPLGSLSMLPHHAGLSQGRKLSSAWRARLYLLAFILLMLIVPFRKVVLDTNGPLLAAILAAVGLLAMLLGYLFKFKSAWCSSLCPVYPVELLYGSRPQVTVANAHCATCQACVAPCSESTASPTPETSVNTKLGRWVGVVFVGCFPGFVWGWYQLTTYSGWEGFQHLHLAYGIPYAAGLVTLALYLLLRKSWPRQQRFFVSLFAAAAIITYYWFRLPPVFGIGDPDAAMIVDISPWLPVWSVGAMRLAVVIVFSWLLLGRNGLLRTWEIRPPLVGKNGRSQQAVASAVSSAGSP